MTLQFIAVPIVLAVVKVASIAGVGFLLARRGLLHPAALADVSRLIINIAVPCLLFANAARGLSGMSGAGAFLAVAGSPVVLGLGAAAGFLLSRLLRVERTHLPSVVCAATFQNSAYLPIAVASAVLPPLASLVPSGPHTLEATIAGTVVVFISLFGVLYSPLFWGIGLAWLTGAIGILTWRERLLPPPVLGVLLGLGVGLTPALRDVLTGPHAPLAFAYSAVSDIGSLAVPLANLVLGATLAGVGGGRFVQMRDAFTVIVCRLLLVPGLILLTLWLLRAWWSGSSTGCVAAFVVFLQAAQPSATNLAVMSRARSGSDAEQVVPGLLLACYTAALFTLPAWLVLFFRLLAER